VSFSDSRAHFDECHFSATTERIRAYYAAAVKSALSFPVISDCDQYNSFTCSSSGPADSLDYFAKILHPVQDFYAHTNWVENGRLVLAFPENVPGIPEFPLLTPYTTIRGLRVVEGAPPPGWVVRTPAHDATYPASVLVTVDMPGSAPPEPALISGQTSTDLDPSPPNACPRFRGPGAREIGHDQLAKDAPPTGPITDAVVARRSLAFGNARALAVAQTAEEWCRFVRLVRIQHQQPGDWALYDKWVEDLDDARCGDDADLESASGPSLGC